MNELALRRDETALDVQYTLPEKIEAVLIQGDLAKLEPRERVQYYRAVCRSLGLNHLTNPFEYIAFQGKLKLYAKKDCTDQIRSLRRVSVEIVGRERDGDLYIVTARATTPDGRSDEEIGVVNIKGLTGELLANALMKGSTKAKRRVTLAICGLGWADESEVDTVPGSAHVTVDHATGEIIEPQRHAALPARTATRTTTIDSATGEVLEPASASKSPKRGKAEENMATLILQLLALDSVPRDDPELARFSEYDLTGVTDLQLRADLDAIRAMVAKYQAPPAAEEPHDPFADA